MPHELHNKTHFEQLYAGKAPWDIGRPQPAFVEAAPRVTGSVLDVGCGTGENALFFAERGQQVAGIDFLKGPIAEASRKARERGVPATFRVMDALDVNTISEDFDSVIDCGLFHTFSDDDRRRYVTALAGVVKPNGRLFLLCFSDKEPAGDGPRRVSQGEIHDSFASGWDVESIQESRFEIRPDLEDIQFSEGGPRAWFCVIRRAE